MSAQTMKPRESLEVVMDQMMMGTDLTYDGAIEKLIDELKAMRTPQFMLAQVIAVDYESRAEMSPYDMVRMFEDLLKSTQMKYGAKLTVRGVAYANRPHLVFYEGTPTDEELEAAVDAWTVDWYTPLDD